MDIKSYLAESLIELTIVDKKWIESAERRIDFKK
jgi:hypothetical protein